jgi:hypothetical protein
MDHIYVANLKMFFIVGLKCSDFTAKISLCLNVKDV